MSIHLTVTSRGLSLAVVGLIISQFNLLAGCGWGPLSAAFDRESEIGAWSNAISEELRTRTRSVGDPLPWGEVGVESDTVPVPRWMVPASSEIHVFYQRRSFRPAWIGPSGLLSQATELLACLRASIEDGLIPAEYATERIEAIIGRPPNLTRSVFALGLLAEVDLLLSNAFLNYANHLLRGRVEPHRVNEAWQVRAARADLAGLMQTALDLHRVGETLEMLRPQQLAYHRLREALGVYSGIGSSGGWQTLPFEAGELKKGDRNLGVAALSRRLLLTGDLEASAAVASAFDSVLEQAVIRFQNRNGLDAHGRVDDNTLRALNVPVAVRVSQIKANLERWRWLPHELGSRCVVVRIADFELDLMEEGRVVSTMRAIVGKPYRRTPLFSSYMTHLVFHPSWNVPRRIAAEEILPILKRNAEYLQNRGIVVLERGGGETEVVAPSGISWQQVDDKTFPYRLVQAPGPFNPLGRVKFAFPNPFDIAIHDTPDRSLFSERERDLSHGCIRVEDGEELARFALQDDRAWGPLRIAAAFEMGSPTRSVPLREPIPVYVLYWTVWVDAAGKVQFRRDLYDIDSELSEALNGRHARMEKRFAL